MKINIFSILKIFKHGIVILFTDKKITDLYPFHVARKILPKRSKTFISVDLFKCNLCEKCLDFCPTNAIKTNKVENSITINYAKCMFCGNCTNVCSKYALIFVNNFEAASNIKELYEYTFYLKKGTY